MSNFGNSLTSKKVEDEFFLALFKDNPDDTWYNVCFVNNSDTGLQYVKSEALELSHSKNSKSDEAFASLKNEYVNILPREYLFLEKIDLLDEKVDVFRYDFTLARTCNRFKVSCFFHRYQIHQMSREMAIPIVNRFGHIYLCA